MVHLIFGSDKIRNEKWFNLVPNNLIQKVLILSVTKSKENSNTQVEMNMQMMTIALLLLGTYQTKYPKSNLYLIKNFYGIKCLKIV